MIEILTSEQRKSELNFLSFIHMKILRFEFENRIQSWKCFVVVCFFFSSPIPEDVVVCT